MVKVLRKINQIKKKAEANEIQQPKQPRTVEELLEIWDGSEAAEEINNEEILSLIDAGAKKDAVRKVLDGEVKTIKKILLIHAENQKWKTKAGENAVCKIRQSTSTKLAATILAKLLKKFEKSNLFNDLVSVKIGEVKRYLGEQCLEGLTETETKEYGTVSLKLLK